MNFLEIRAVYGNERWLNLSLWFESNPLFFFAARQKIMSSLRSQVVSVHSHEIGVIVTSVRCWVWSARLATRNLKSQTLISIMFLIDLYKISNVNTVPYVRQADRPLGLHIAWYCVERAQTVIHTAVKHIICTWFCSMGVLSIFGKTLGSWTRRSISWMMGARLPLNVLDA